MGAASVAWFSVPRAGFRYVGAAPAQFRSSPKVTRRFCGACGTSLTYESDDFPDELDITIASLDDPASMAPRDHTQAAGKLPWDHLGDGLPAYPQTRPAAELTAADHIASRRRIPYNAASRRGGRVA